ncbi:MAG: division/cell wall cluster transcriptional repressor MraZ [Candidatus Pacebacteria bacterium]|nr:division/cell wall cluster transcriptional repressor MraZ [Candidatus Paceibacterota bacterium]PIR63795.1 MAG: division/cell wall cluster transcriptional repressor MraZ [Candidatus Pacebacteria bacterium CG10_big_fil_rev_8_21_14_0_10_40_26]PIZ78581.1 MAG: division/cell wall cluster transcriptional repressor MraZ [Candidatus Pacebacteria bacterium CG_4_10_14_0_2_um_filter_40_20]PJA69432.1 MAG: division/cell wall cluster transcriptional repressor MraZ [Candidatus Pacebacteria bacterium CG_4_9_1
MYIGKYYHTVEDKGRVSLPKAFRSATDSWILTRGLDGGLFLYEAEKFTQELQKLEARSFTKKTNRDFIRLMTNDAVHVSPDGNGRVQLPEYLNTFAHITKDVVIVGSYSYIEIWDRDTYHTYLETLESNAEDIAESLDD